MRNVVIYVHGKGGSAEEAAHYRRLFPDREVIGFAYQAQTPWEAKAEFPAFFARQWAGGGSVTLIANSIGAYFAMSALDETLVDSAFFISPVVDMEGLILRMMQDAGVSEQTLAEKQEVATALGETLSWRYLCYVRRNPVVWNVPTCILYGQGDHLTSAGIISAFAQRHGAKLTVMPGGEHWFHTEEQMRFLDDWLRKQSVTVGYAAQDELPRVNELRRMVSQLHAEGRPDIFRPGFCEELQQRAYQAFQEPDADVIAARAGDVLCGFAVVRYADMPESAYMCARRFYHIEEFGVDEAYRGCGAGTALLRFCRAEAKRRGFDRLTLDVWAFNQGAQRFYEAAGFHAYRHLLELRD